MSKVIFIDTGPLGKLTHPKPEQNTEYVEWIEYARTREYLLVIPEIVDYELRRSLILNSFGISIERLDSLKTILIYDPITTNIMKRAAELWAQARARHRPTADNKDLDADVILAAQAQLFDKDADVRVLTENIGHLGQFVNANTLDKIL